MIQKIAGRILNYIYVSKFEKNKIPSVEEIVEQSKYPPHQIEMALDYCSSNEYLIVIKMVGSDKNGIHNMIIRGLTAKGMDVAANNDKFKKHFTVGVNLGLISFNWGADEK